MLRKWVERCKQKFFASKTNASSFGRSLFEKFITLLLQMPKQSNILFIVCTHSEKQKQNVQKCLVMIIEAESRMRN